MLVLQYIDDALVFLDAKLNMIENLRVLLLWFKAASRLQVNMSITKVYRVNNMEGWDKILHT